MFTARAPGPSFELPAPLVALLEGREAEAVWLNALDGVTVRLPQEGAFLKWQPPGSRLPPLVHEEERLRWAADELASAGRVDGVAVPRVLEHGQDERGEWLLTAALPGRSAVDPHWIERPELAVPGIGRALRRLHEAFDPERCPYDWSVEQRLLAAPFGTEPLGEAPSIDRLVVCQGDACAPNTLLDDDGVGIGHVDLGMLGVADRWADLAVAALSTEWNFGPGWQRALVEAYGVEWDEPRIRYYQALWNAE